MKACLIKSLARTFGVAAFWTMLTVAAAAPLTGEEGDAILGELKQIRHLLEQQLQAPPSAARPSAPPADDKVSVHLEPGGYWIGRADAPLTLVEYTDYQCPFCRQFHITTFEEIKKNYIDTGMLRYVSRDFPLDMHDNARRAAIAARCAADQGKFWEMRHVMFVNATQLQTSNLVIYARDLGLDVEKFATCTSADKYQAAVAGDIAEGKNAGVSGTPSFVVGHVEDNTIAGARIVGALPYGAFDAKLKELVAKSPPK